MKLQTATRLGLYAILELARDPERTLSSAELAERFGVSSHHLAKVMGTLSTAGFVRGGRGAAGGYRFTGNRRRITLMDIVALFEPAPGNRAKEPGEDTDIGAVAAARADRDRRDRRGDAGVDHARDDAEAAKLLIWPCLTCRYLPA